MIKQEYKTGGLLLKEGVEKLIQELREKPPILFEEQLRLAGWLKQYKEISEIYNDYKNYLIAEKEFASRVVKVLEGDKEDAKS